MDALAGEPSLIPGGGIQVIGGIEKGREGKATEGGAGGQSGALKRSPEKGPMATGGNPSKGAMRDAGSMIAGAGSNSVKRIDMTASFCHKGKFGLY